MGPLVPRERQMLLGSPRSFSLVPSSLIQNKCFRNMLLPGDLRTTAAVGEVNTTLCRAGSEGSWGCSCQAQGSQGHMCTWGNMTGSPRISARAGSVLQHGAGHSG